MENKRDRFVIVGSGCSGAVPLCYHLIRGLKRDMSEQAAVKRNLISPTNASGAPAMQACELPRIQHQLSGSEGPCSSKDSSEMDLQPLKIPDVDSINCDIWHSSSHEISPEFELFTRTLLFDLQAGTRCRCQLIQEGGKKFEKERRNNVSCLLQVASDGGEEEYSNVLVDCGKTFRDACIKVLVPLKVTELDEVLITHGHADAAGGMDDLREFQTYSIVPVGNTLRHICHRVLPVTCTKTTADEILVKNDYCFAPGPEEQDNDRWQIQPDGGIVMKSRWPACKINYIEDYLDSQDLSSPKAVDNNDRKSKMVPIHSGAKKIILRNHKSLHTTFYPVFHGGDYISMGFGFGTRQRVLYLSDVKAISSGLLKKICLDGPWELLVIDCVAPVKHHFSHATLYEVLHWARVINPKVVRLVGMTCVFPPEETEMVLSKWLKKLKETESSAGQGISGISEQSPTRIEELNLAFDGEVFELFL
eukprot:GHVH01006355.1.p1 GENE.GHVH01006355.1~~GHVH01006355.1.p1  ORF type:complete len:476 (+),score=66.04 GHVH01006355.1:231-1658(+)